MSASAFGACVARDAVSVRGADAHGFLQGQISQDVDAIGPGGSAWSLLLAPQGKVDAWFRLTRTADGGLLADLDAGFAAAFVARLERFRLRVDVTFEVLEGWRMVSVRGGASDLDPGAVRAEVAAEVSWPGFEGIDLLGPDVVLPPALADSPDRLEVARIRAGWPSLGRELTERTIPAEVGGLVEASASFTKGCYTGQELVARIDSRGGRVPRPVRLLEIASGLPAPGTAIVANGQAVGEITSAAVDATAAVTVALGTVQRRVQPPAPAEVAGAPATVLATPATADAVPC